MILAGDIGGTNARLALVPANAKRPARVEVFASRAYESLEAVLRAFLGKRPPKIVAASFGVAGPVLGNRCVATNLPWVIDGRLIARRLKIKRVTLINDLVALGLGAFTVQKSKLVLLQGDAPPKRKGANVSIIAAGTGLGEAALVWDGMRLVPCGTEGGHADFAPRDELEAELLMYLRRKIGGRVSYERILSGPGMGNLYDFFREAKHVGEDRDVSEAIATSTDRNAAIGMHGLDGSSEACTRAVEVFASLYGAEAGNLALKTLSVGGVFVAGGISASLVKVLGRHFARAFSDKGRFSSLLAKIPIAVVLDSQIGLAGSAFHALHPSG